MFKRWLSAGLILLAMALMSGGIVAHADNEDYVHALQTAPQGILLDKGSAVMTLGTASMSSAAIVDTMNPATPDTQVALLTHGPNQFGSIWSTNDNDFNLKKDETVSMWMYFGDQGTGAGGGMAFVLQNDDRGTAAMPTFKFPLAETLGVWGVDSNPREQSSMAIAKTAIQNSWALEFDTETNAQNNGHAPGSANSFDLGYPGNHIAAGYPGLATTYHQYVDEGSWFTLTRDKYYYALKHFGLLANTQDPGFLSNGQWHHVSIHWSASAQTMTYTINDKNPQTGQPQIGVSHTVFLDPRVVNPGNRYHDKVRWGITSAVGGKWSNNLVIFENTPGNIDAETSATLTDLTLNREIKNHGETVARDRVRLDYHLDYRDGRQSWSQVVANLKLPKFIDFEDAKITYSGDQSSETLDVKDITDNQLRAKLGQAMDHANPSATISLTGRVAAVAKTTEVAQESSTFSSTALIRTAETPAFTITPSVDLNLAVTSGQAIDLNPQQGTTVKGKVTVTGATTQPTVKVKPTLNRLDLPAVTVRDDGSFNLPLTPDMLNAGKNTLTLRATTADGSQSNLVTITITVAGELKFSSISSNESFEPSELTGQNQLVHREGDWQLVVQDTRGIGSQWTLLAQADPFVNSDGTKLSGGPVYVTPDGITPIGTTPTPVLTHTTNAMNSDGKFNVAAHWSQKTGVLLDVDQGTLPGNYAGSITWTLTDAPE
ncbi:lectin-like domain-containing protein [Levilactobacillus sp. HBUAS70063]|uniref:lectin-like domain-containing protein n=1 Tax=Levilactobacillus sp. HBUAS70063 TaxID=3109359 RepID=UPI0031335609